jgi:DNA-binding response OmpR family regulator
MRVLISHTDQQLAEERAQQLRMDGHNAAVALTAHATALRLAEQPDALVLCQFDSAVHTIALLRALRAGEIPRTDAAIPVLVVGADSDQDAIRYYQAGADGTLPAGSSPLLITAALDALGRRTGGHQRSRHVRVGRLTIDRDARTAHVDEQPLHLTRLEFDLLDTLAGQPGKAFTRAEITRQVWGYDPDAVGPSRTIDSTAHRLRKKLVHAGAEPIPHTIRGVGWRLGT